jgi:uncharacterized caspase-like protein
MKKRVFWMLVRPLVLSLVIGFSAFAPPVMTLAKAQVDERGMRVQSAKEIREWPNSANRWALVIGIDGYDDNGIGSLEGAVNDAKVLAETLVKKAGFPANQVILLTSDQSADRRLTRVNILRQMSFLTAIVPQDGLLLLAYSGHGIQIEKQMFLIPSDASLTAPLPPESERHTALAMGTTTGKRVQPSVDVKLLEETAVNSKRLTDDIRQKAQQMVIILDACRTDIPVRGSGGVVVTGAKLGLFATRNNLYERNHEVVAFAILYATASGAKAYEGRTIRRGYLTSAIVKGIEGEAANAEGDVTLAGLVKYVQTEVPELTKTQLGVEQRPFALIEGYKADQLVIAVTSPKNNK